jgi:hypothetical protein
MVKRISSINLGLSLAPGKEEVSHKAETLCQAIEDIIWSKELRGWKDVAERAGLSEEELKEALLVFEKAFRGEEFEANGQIQTAAAIAGDRLAAELAEENQEKELEEEEILRRFGSAVKEFLEKIPSLA